ncbi:uncharacterized protein A4U43_C07F7580 [Asparagus officinalis]|uniref:Uncharacterized protein n=1 Tax=Asparagus officinalis TaxID=4686 RepID=A0A5P1EA29_ASPOF|nr:uncharacterized protein A4U43_C07F7580 [Asparagus officinalis]
MTPVSRTLVETWRGEVLSSRAKMVEGKEGGGSMGPSDSSDSVIGPVACLRTMRALQVAGIPMDAIQGRACIGAIFTTCGVTRNEDNFFEILSGFHWSHCNSADPVMALFLGE